MYKHISPSLFGDRRTASRRPPQATARAPVVGPNAVRSHQVRAWAVLGRQLRSALLVLPVVAASIAFVLEDHTDAIIIGAILAVGIGLGFVSELVPGDQLWEVSRRWPR